MEVWLIILLVIAGVLIVAGLIVGLVLLILALTQHFGGTSGGLLKLAQMFPAANPMSGQVSGRETVKIGAVVYKRCATLGVADEGLYISTWGKAVLIPWNEFKSVTSTTLYWKRAPMLTVGEPPVATVVVAEAVFHQMRPRLPRLVRDWIP